MENLIIKYTKAIAAQLYNKEISIRFEHIDACGVCLYVCDEILFNKRLVAGVTEVEVEYWWNLMVHEVTHFEIQNGETKTHSPKFYTVMRRNLKAVENLKVKMLREAANNGR